MLEVKVITIGDHVFPCVKIDKSVLLDYDPFFFEKTPYVIYKYGEHFLPIRDYMDIILNTFCIECECQTWFNTDTQEVEILFEDTVNLLALGKIFAAFAIDEEEFCISSKDDRIQLIFK